MHGLRRFVFVLPVDRANALPVQLAAHFLLRTTMRASTEERFWKKVNKNGPVIRSELGPCWLWIGSTLKCGYGQFSINGRLTTAHRAGYLLFVGPLPARMNACHSCEKIVKEAHAAKDWRMLPPGPLRRAWEDQESKPTEARP